MTRDEALKYADSFVVDNWDKASLTGSGAVKHVVLTLEALGLIKFEQPDEQPEWTVHRVPCKRQYAVGEGKFADVRESDMVDLLRAAGYTVEPALARKLSQ